MALKDELEALEALKNTLGDLLIDDPDLLIDSVEGETNLFEIVDKLLFSYQDYNMKIKTNKETIKKIEERNKSFEKSQQNIKDLLLLVLSKLDVEKHKKDLKRPLATLSYIKGRETGKIIDESLIPMEYWEKQEPKLNKKLINEHIKEGKEIKGVELFIGENSIGIRGI